MLLTKQCHFISDFRLTLLSLLLHSLRLWLSAGSGFDRLLDDASGLLFLNLLLRSGSDVCISSFLTSSTSSAVVGESRLMTCEFVLFRGLLHNLFSSLLLGDSRVVSTRDVIDVCGVGLKLKLSEVSLGFVARTKLQFNKIYTHTKLESLEFRSPKDFN